MMNNKGAVLLVVLWVLVFLSLIAWGLSRRSSLEVSLMETYRGKLHSYAAARGGMNMVMGHLQKSPLTKNTLYASGISFDQTKSPQDVFSHMAMGEHTHADVQWLAFNFNTYDEPYGAYGITDEAGRININAINDLNVSILTALFQLYGLSPTEANRLSFAVLDYAKKKRYQHVLELLEVEGMTQEIFDRMKSDVTVYGDVQRGLWINTATASNNVIQAVANAASQLNPAVNASYVASQAYELRDGPDGESFTEDDGMGSLAGIDDPNWPAALQEGDSGYFRVRVVGVDAPSGTRTVLEAVVHRTSQACEIVSWQRN